MDFEFDPAKAAGNLRKHGVSFADAEGVFMDHLAMHRIDPRCCLHLARRVDPPDFSSSRYFCRKSRI
jgi:uncharacterized DUF497 family protein